MVQRRGQPGVMLRLDEAQRTEHAAHAEVVGHATVDQVDVGMVDAVVVLRSVVQFANDARGRPRRDVGFGEALHPRRHAVAAGAAVVIEGHRREHHRHSRRCCRSTRQLHRIEVRTEEVEEALVEAHASAATDVGGRGYDEGAGLAVQVAEGRTVEQDLVVQLGRQFGAAPAGGRQLAPVARIEAAGDEFALHVAFQETLFVVAEQLLAIQAVGQCGEAAAGHAGDDVHAIEQAHAAAVGRDDLGASQVLEHPVREGRGACAPAREGQDDQVLLVAGVLLPRLVGVARVSAGLRDRRVDRAAGAASEAEQGDADEHQRPAAGARRSIEGVHGAKRVEDTSGALPFRQNWNATPMSAPSMVMLCIALPDLRS